MFADPGISDELAEKLVAFVDREAGRDAPLSADDETMVLDLLKHDVAVQNLVEDLRATNTGLDSLLDDVAAVEVPDKLVALIRGHAASDVLIADQTGKAASLEDKGDVIELRHPKAPGFGYGGLAAAASIALFVACGALLHVYTTYEDDRVRFETTLAEASKTAETRQRELADASAELERLTALREQATHQSELVSRQLTENEDITQRLEVEQAALQGRYNGLLGENERLSDLVAERTTELAAVDQEREQVMADLASMRDALETERSETSEARSLLRSQTTDFTDELANKQERLAELSEELENTLKQSAANSTDLAEARAGQRALQSRLAALEADRQELATEREVAKQAAIDAEQKVTALEGNFVLAENARQATVRQVSSLKADLAASKNWLGQISQYHRVYASTARRHLVEVGADEQEHIEQWLGKMLKRPMPVPDLSAYGVTFAGARLLGINEKPVAQLVYLDANDQPLALCVIPSTGEVKAPTFSANRDLNLVDWRDGQHGYAVVGWSDPALLASLAEAIQPAYDL